MGWGMLGGAVVDSYQKANKLARDQAWEDEQRAEFRRQRDQDAAMDAASNDSGAAVAKAIADAKAAQAAQAGQQGSQYTAPEAPTAAPAQGLKLGGGVQPASAVGGVVDSAFPVPQSAPSYPAPKQPVAPMASDTGVPAYMAPKGQPEKVAPSADYVESTRTYTGDDGKQYLTVPRTTPPRVSEIMLEHATRMMSAGAGQKGYAKALEMRKEAYAQMQTENTQELNSIMYDKTMSPAEKMMALTQKVGNTPSVPGSASLAHDKDGKLVLRHTVPGKGEMDIPLNGSDPAAVLGDLYSKVAAMTSPELIERRKAHEEEVRKNDITAQHYEWQHKDTSQRNADRAENAAARIALERQSMGLQEQLSEARLSAMRQHKWVGTGLMKDGSEIERDEYTGEKRLNGVPILDTRGSMPIPMPKKDLPDGPIPGGDGTDYRLNGVVGKLDSKGVFRPVESFAPVGEAVAKGALKFSTPPNQSQPTQPAKPAAQAPQVGTGVNLSVTPTDYKKSDRWVAAEKANAERKAVALRDTQAAYNEVLTRYNNLVRSKQGGQSAPNPAMAAALSKELQAKKAALDNFEANYRPY